MQYPLVCLLYCTTACDHNCNHCLVNKLQPTTLSHDQVERNLFEFRQLGGRYVDLTGGNPLLVVWLEDILKYARKLHLLSSLTLSGPQMLTRGEDLFPLPNIVRISIDGNENYHNRNRGQDCYTFIREGLKISRHQRRSQIQLIFTVIPGGNGNICREQLVHVLELAREFQVLVNVNPLFNIETLSERELKDLKWFARQADVQCSQGKLRFILRGGNNIKNPTCRALHNTLTISADNKLLLPCYHHQFEGIDLSVGLKTALDLPLRTNLLGRDGRFDFCQGCSIWCYIVPSWLSHVFDRIVVWKHGLSGFQSCRDTVLRYCGRFKSCPYPDFLS